MVFSKKGFRLVLKKIGLGLVLGLGLGFRFAFGFGKLIGGAVGTVGWVSRKLPVQLTRLSPRNHDVYILSSSSSS